MIEAKQAKLSSLAKRADELDVEVSSLLDLTIVRLARRSPLHKSRRNIKSAHLLANPQSDTAKWGGGGESVQFQLFDRVKKDREDVKLI